ncbi:MAG: aminotransferase class V-fold PLP-dependent enzyme [Oscillospiraceae bacterium]
MITISGHKIHAPKGIGALRIRSGLKLPSYILGGGQDARHARRHGANAADRRLWHGG